MTNPDAIIKIVEFKILQKKAELRIKPELDFFLSLRQDSLLIYMRGIQND